MTPAIVWRFLPDGGFVTGHTESRATAYAYPTSSSAVRANRAPSSVAADMLARQTCDRSSRLTIDHDRRNWILLNGGTP